MIKNREIAKILNISPSAVSLALNNRPGISEETRRKVIALRNGAMAADYNILQQHNMDSSKLLFLVLKKHGAVISETPFFMILSESLHQQANLEGFILQSCYTAPGIELSHYLSPINIDLYDGIIILGTEADDEDIQSVIDLGKPTIVIDAWFENLNVDCVLMDNQKGICQAVRHVYTEGHREIGFIGSSVNANNFTERFNAYKNELSNLNIAYNSDYVHNVHPTIDGAEADMFEFLNQNPPIPSVYICANDIIAMGVLNALSNCGYRIPEDVSITGFDDMTVSAHLNPPLTSVSFNPRKIATSAVQLLVSKIKVDAEEQNENVRCLIGTKLQVRKSCLTK